MSTALKTFDWQAPDYVPILQERTRRLKAMRGSPDILAAHLKIYSEDPIAFIRDWGFTYDPRREGTKFIPFILFDRQIKFIEWLLQHLEGQTDGLCEKSRDMGVTWLCVAFAWWAYRFKGPVSLSFGSRKEMLVDHLGNPDSIFEKLRLFYRRLPKFFLPKGFKANDHDAFMRLQNPETGAAITGEAGDNIGRGGRSPQPLDAKILTPNGWTTMRGLKVGDKVVGGDGGPTEVLGVYPLGWREVYRVEFSDGSSTECTADHLWEVTTSAIRKANKRQARKRRAPSSKIIPLSEMMDRLRKPRGDGQVEWEYQIPLVAPVRFAPSDLPLDPYLVGALLGDGSLSQTLKRPPCFTSVDTELVDLVRERLPEYCIAVKYSGIEYRLVDERGARGRGHRSPLKAGLMALGLVGTTSHTKFIPDAYKFADPDARLEVLRGLLDTDGWVGRRKSKAAGSKVGYCSVSQRLATDVQYLAQSLGGTATITTRPGQRRRFPDGNIRECSMSYHVTIALPNGINPYRLKRKADLFKPRTRYQPRRSVVGIYPVGKKPVQCIEVGAPDRLYATDGCVLTHNTMYFVDEFAHVPRAEAVLSALEDNSDCKLYLSSVNGVGNAFYRIRHSGEYDVFVFDWRDNPLKSQEWYDAECRKRDPVTIAKELDRDYEAAVENVCIPGRWVRSALEPEMAAIEASRYGVAGLDIGGGGADKTVFLTRHGPYVDNIEAWSDGDTTATAHKAANLYKKHRLKVLNFDVIGVGAGVASTLKRRQGVSSRGINVGNKPSKRRWPDGKRSDEKFKNLKAELWFVMRERFRKTFEHVNHLRGVEGGERHPVDELISLPDCQDLMRELSSVRWFFTETGKIRMESKDELKRRGIKSPDHADALALTFVERPAGGGVHKLEGFY